MKKIIIGIVILIASTFLFANEKLSFITAAYNYGVFTERAEQAQTKLISNGFDLSDSIYFNNTWGFYLNTDYLFPSEATVRSGGLSITTTSSDWDFSMLLSMIIGPTIRHNITDDFEIFGALGFHVAEYSLSSKYSAALNFSFGLGGDLGIRYLLSDHFYLSGGCLLSHDFYYKGKISTAYGTNKVSDTYNFGSFRPYIGIGYTYKTITK